MKSKKNLKLIDTITRPSELGVINQAKMFMKMGYHVSIELETRHKKQSFQNYVTEIIYTLRIYKLVKDEDKYGE